MQNKNDILKAFKLLNTEVKEVGKTLYFISEDICQKFDKENNNQTNQESEAKE